MSLFRLKSILLVLGLVSLPAITRADTASFLYEGITTSGGGIRIVASSTNSGYSGIRIATGASAYEVSSVDLVVYLGSSLGSGITRGTPQLDIFTVDGSETYYRRPDFASPVGTTFDYTATIGSYVNPGYASIVELTPDAPVFLAANTEYWFLVSMVTGANQQLEILGSASASGPGYQHIIGTSDIGSTNFNVASGDYMLNINATPIPEPATFAMLGGMLVLGLAAWQRHRRR